VSREYPVRILNGYEVKPFSILHCPFEEVILLDADNVPIVDPVALLHSPQYAEHGAIFWPDYGWLGPERSIWRVMGLEPRGEREVESGQIVVDKRRCWHPVLLTMWLNEHSDFFYRHIHGDKDTFHVAWRKLGQDYAMPDRGVHSLGSCTMCQHDFQGNRILQHRNFAKWRLRGNRRVRGFEYERECLAFLQALHRQWSGRVGVPRSPSPEEQALSAEIADTRLFEYVRVGHDRRLLELRPNHRIGQGGALCEQEWWITTTEEGLALSIYGQDGLTCRLVRNGDPVWRGHWEHHEKMPIELSPQGQ